MISPSEAMRCPNNRGWSSVARPVSNALDTADRKVDALTAALHSEVVKVCTSGGELLTEVALANTPSELRDELRARLSSKVPEEQTSPISMRALLRKLRDIADEEGVVDVDSVSNHLRKNEVDAPAEGLMEQAEVEGLVLRLDETRWMFFE